MRICQLRLSGFRGIKEATVAFPVHGVLFGPNNVGKSSITEAIALLLGRDRMAPPLTDWDFYKGQPKPDTRFEIVAAITGFGKGAADEPEMFPDWFLGEKAARPVWWSEETQTLSTQQDRPLGTQLAAQVALSACFVEETCDFETIRYYYDGPCDPFTDDHRTVPPARFRELGVFFLPSSRQWDRLLSFGSSTFIKVLRQADAVPGTDVESLKTELSTPNTKIEDAPNFKPILQSAQEELRAFLLIDRSSNLVYRTTSLDTTSVLQSLTPHILHEGSLLPFSRHGAGMVSLQAFLLVLAFAAARQKEGKNFILVAEEPELHLHPALHRRLANRIRGAGTQSIITTHSPLVAASYPPTEALFIRNEVGTLSATFLRRKPVSVIGKNAIKDLYLRKREALYEALMGGAILIPEGQLDHEWLSLWQRIVESSEQCTPSALTIVPTESSQVALTFREIQQFRPDAVPFVDGDSDGQKYVDDLAALTSPPKVTIRLGDGAAIEALSAWILEPCLTAPGVTMAALLPDAGHRLRKDLLTTLCHGSNKSDRELHENLAWEALGNAESVTRASDFLADVRRIVSGGMPVSAGWSVDAPLPGMRVFRAAHISKT
jgi:hypothetical protein